MKIDLNHTQTPLLPMTIMLFARAAVMRIAFSFVNPLPFGIALAVLPRIVLRPLLMSSSSIHSTNHIRFDFSRDDEIHPPKNGVERSRTPPIVRALAPLLGRRKASVRSAQKDAAIPLCGHQHAPVDVRPPPADGHAFLPAFRFSSGTGLMEEIDDELARRAEQGTRTSGASIEPPPSAVETEPAASGRRQSLLDDYCASSQRPLDLAHALAAIKLRRAAEIHCKKSEWARLTPRLPRMGGARRRFEDLAAMPIDHLIADIEAHPQSYSRTLLTDVAQMHLLAALNVDLDRFKKGVRSAGRFEGVHSVVGRATTAAASGASLGFAQIPGASHALDAAKKTVKVLAHELPPNVLNPFLTGSLRSKMDVKQAITKRVGGQTVVVEQIEASQDMATLVGLLDAERRALNEAVARFGQTGDASGLDDLVDAFLTLQDTADRKYKRRIGLNRTQTYSKGYGMAVNAVGVAGSVVTATVPVVGQIAGPAILGAAIPLQWGAGYLDEHTKQRYNLRANTKWGDFLAEDASALHFKDLTVEHVSEPALRKSFLTHAQVQVAGIREVYEDELGDWMRECVELEAEIAVMEAAGKGDMALAPSRARLARLDEQMRGARQHVDDFESFDAQRWSRIPADSTIGRCLDDLKALEQANCRARYRKPGEVAQIVQRYAQAFHAGLSTGVMLPVVDGLTTTDALYSHDAAGRDVALLPRAEAAAAAAGAVGGGVFAATTGEVRVGKAKNKKLLSQLPADTEPSRADASRWVFQAGQRRVDLRNTGGYRKHLYSTWDEVKQIGRTLPHSLFGGPVGLAHLARAKHARHLAKGALRDALDALAAAYPPRSLAPSRAETIAAMKDELYACPAVRRTLGVGRPAD